MLCVGSHWEWQVVIVLEHHRPFLFRSNLGARSHSLASVRTPARHNVDAQNRPEGGRDRNRDPNDTVFILMQRHNAGEIGLVAADDFIMEVLLARKETQHMHIPWRQLCFHECNRDGVLGNQTKAPSLVEDVHFIGWSDKAVSQAVCAEAEPGNTRSGDLNRSWAETSLCPMAPVVKGNINDLTLSCGHTTQGMRCIVAMVE